MEPTPYTLNDIENALHQGEMRFHFQPKVSFNSGQILGVEALLRWQRDDGTLIPPGDFLPLAESTGFITDITAVMLNELVDDIAKLRAVRPDIQVAFNVSAQDLQSPYLVKMLRSFIRNKRIDAHNIQIEVTETAVIDNDTQAAKVLRELVDLGIECLMDDFGTGYASIDVLSRMPFSAIKIDRGIIHRMSQDERSTQILRSILFMAREMGLRTIAEGIETESEYTYLMTSGCDEGQGFWMGKPQSLDDTLALIQRETVWPNSRLGLLYNAWISHMSYRRQVLDSVNILAVTPREEWGDLPRLTPCHSAKHCQLGHWYGEKGKQGNAADYADLRSHHEEMHEHGELTIALLYEEAEASLIIETMTDFLVSSNRVDARVISLIGATLGRTLNGSLDKSSYAAVPPTVSSSIFKVG